MKSSETQIEVIEQPIKPETALNKYFTMSLDLLCIYGNGYFKQLSPVWEKILGWTPSELYLQPWTEFVHPDDWEITRSAEKRCRQQDIVEYENRFRHKNGNYRWLSWRISRDENELFYGIAKDITAAKRLEEELCDRYNKAMLSTNESLSQISPRFSQESVPRRVKVGTKTSEEQAKYSSLELSSLTQSAARVEVEQKNLERVLIELTQWKNRYEAVSQISGQLLYELDSQTDKLIWGRNIEQVLGYCPKELEGRRAQLSELIHPNDLEKTQQKMACVIATKEPLHLEYRIRKKDGTYITVEDKGQFYSDGRGNLNCMVGFMVDISDRKLADASQRQAMAELEQRVEERTAELKQANERLQIEMAEHQRTEAALRQNEEQFRTQHQQTLEALRQSETRYRAIVEDQTELICRFTPDSTITFVNNAYCRYFNKPRESLLGHKFLPLMPPEDRKLIAKNFGFLSIENPINTYEHRVIMPDGDIRWQQWSDRALFDECGNFIECQAVGRDITQLKQAEADIRKALEKEKELSELRSSFMSLVSHEFRTPLTTIQSSAELLEYYSHKLSDEKKRNHFSRIQTAVIRMTQLLDDVLTIGQAEAGKLQFNPHPMNLVAFCRDIVEGMQITASQEHTLNFVVKCDCTNAQADEKLLGHIVTNLLSNAIKYSPQGGNVQFVLSCNQSSVIFCIQDNGIGIPEGDLEKLFESFKRASNVGTIQGTGLGLAIVKKCVDIHGGEITVESQLGVGTTFTVTLPLNRQTSHLEEETN